MNNKKLLTTWVEKLSSLVAFALIKTSITKGEDTQFSISKYS